MIGHDGRIITSPDGREWTATADSGIAAYNLAGASNEMVLATTEDGPYRSEDDGATWAPVHDTHRIRVATDTGIEVSSDNGETFDLLTPEN